MLILYITYVDMDKGASGSAVRPQKMYRAFLDEGHEVKLLSGSQKRADREKRAAAVEEISRWLDANTPDICYIESPATSITFGFDIALIKKIHRAGIPIGYFYRDFYWKFPTLYPRRTDFRGRIKDLYLDIQQRRTDNALKQADVVYFPSEECKKYFSYKNMRTLPPAGENRITERHPENHTCIYVGGIGGGYDIGILLDAFHFLNEENVSYKLILVCRINEWNSFESPWKSAPWLEVYHASGDELEPLYARAAVSAVMVHPTPYTHLAVNVKLFDYLGHGIPVVVTDVRAISKIVRENQIGEVADPDAASVARALRNIMDNPDKRMKLEKNCAEVLQNGNLWIHRVRQVVSDLQKKK